MRPLIGKSIQFQSVHIVPISLAYDLSAAGEMYDLDPSFLDRRYLEIFMRILSGKVLNSRSILDQSSPSRSLADFQSFPA